MSYSTSRYDDDALSGSGCPACSEPLLLRGWDWKSHLTNALFAIEILTILVLISCLVLSTRFKWTRHSGTDKLRRIGYGVATSCSILYFVLVVIITGLQESVTMTTNLFRLVYIFYSFFELISQILITGIIFRTIAESIASPRLFRLSVIPVIIWALMLTAGFGWYVYETAQTIRFGDQWTWLGYDHKLQVARARLIVAYLAVQVVISVIIGIAAVYAVLRVRSKATIVMLAVVTPSYFFRTVIELAEWAMYLNYTYDDIKVLGNLIAATAFLYAFGAMGIFGGLAAIAFMRPVARLAHKHEVSGYESPVMMGRDYR